MGVTGGDLAMRVERLISPHHASAPRITSVLLASALCLSGMLAMASARHLPFPMPWTPNLSLPQAAGMLAAPVASALHLDPTRLDTAGPAPAVRSLVRILPAFKASTQEPVMAPEMPHPTVAVAHDEIVTAPAVTGPIQIGGNPLSTLLGDKNAALSVNKRATAQMKIIGVNPGNTQAPASTHEYCEPITGSRVCN
jgi:hypothetical protein